MDLAQLHSECKKACKSAYANFKHYVSNPIFDLNDDIIKLHIDEMKMNIGMSLYKWYMMNHTYAEKQFKVVQQVENSYTKVTVDFANKFTTKILKA